MWDLQHTPHVETANSCVGLYILGGPIAGDTIGPTQTLARIGSKWLCVAYPLATNPLQKAQLTVFKLLLN